MHYKGRQILCEEHLACCVLRHPGGLAVISGTPLSRPYMNRFDRVSVTTVLEQDLFYSSYTLSVFLNTDKFLTLDAE